MKDFLDISYLNSGSEKQKRAYRIIVSNEIMEKLAPYTPILVGTIPIEVDIDASDLDIICYIGNEEDFTNRLNSYFGHFNGFVIARIVALGAIKANFYIGDFELEIFGQHIPTQKQYAYLHMLTEYQLLEVYGKTLRTAVIELKQKGYKTEPAFAKALDLKGDPYNVLLNVPEHLRGSLLE